MHSAGSPHQTRGPWMDELLAAVSRIPRLPWGGWRGGGMQVCARVRPAWLRRRSVCLPARLGLPARSTLPAPGVTPRDPATGAAANRCTDGGAGAPAWPARIKVINRRRTICDDAFDYRTESGSSQHCKVIGCAASRLARMFIGGVISRVIST